VYKGPSDDPTRKLLEGQLKAQDAFIAAEKVQLQSREQVLQSFYNQEYLNATEYYATRQTLIQDALKLELEAYDKQAAAIAIFIAQAKKETDVQEGRNKLAEVAKKRAAAEVLSSKQLTDAALEQARIYREFDLATSALARQNALANMQAQFQIDLLGKNTLEVAKLTEAKRLQLALEERLYQMRNKNLPQAEMDRAVAESESQKELALALIEQSYRRQREGAFGAAQAMRKYAEDASNTATQVEGAMTQAFQGMEDALVTFVTTGKLSFTDLANSIVADITRMIIKQMMFNALGMGKAGGGGFLETLVTTIAGGGGAQGAYPNAVGDFSAFAPIIGGNGRADGGPVLAGNLYRVNERGPELLNLDGRQYLMMGDRSGRVDPIAQGAAMVSPTTVLNQTINFVNNGPVDRRTQAQLGAVAYQAAARMSARNN
jgi:lambda family phage tail tape measure protein